MDLFFAQSQDPTASNWTEAAKVALQAGPFGGGAFFGGFLAYFLFSLASKERIERHKNDDRRFDQLMEQLKLKDQRIDALHQELAKLKPKK